MSNKINRAEPARNYKKAWEDLNAALDAMWNAPGISKIKIDYLIKRVSEAQATTYRELMSASAEPAKELVKTASEIADWEESQEQMDDDSKIFVDKSLAIADRLRLIMEKKGIRQVDLAKLLGKAEAEISKWLTGMQNYTLRTISKLEAALGQSLIIIPQNEPAKESQPSFTADQLFDFWSAGHKRGWAEAFHGEEECGRPDFEQYCRSKGISLDAAPHPEPSEQSQPERYSRKEIVDIVIDALGNCDDDTRVETWFDENYPPQPSIAIESQSDLHMGTFIFDHENEKEYFLSTDEEKQLDAEAKKIMGNRDLHYGGYRDLCIKLQSQLSEAREDKEANIKRALEIAGERDRAIDEAQEYRKALEEIKTFGTSFDGRQLLYTQGALRSIQALDKYPSPQNPNK